MSRAAAPFDFEKATVNDDGGVNAMIGAGTDRRRRRRFAMLPVAIMVAILILFVISYKAELLK